MSADHDPVSPQQIETDAATLRQVFEGFDRLEAMYRDACAMMSPGQRGYFTPDEDNEVRRMLLAYRNYRLACWDIIWRYYNAYKTPEMQAPGAPEGKVRGFIIGYAAALRLFQKSLRLVEIAEFDPMLRSKLNEPDRKFDLPGGFFEDVLVSYSSLYNYVRILAAAYYWRKNRRLARKLGVEDDPGVGWLIPIIARERRVLRGKFWSILWKRLRRDWGSAWRMLVKPVAMFRYRSRAGIASIVSELRIGRGYVRGIGLRALEHLRDALRPGDVLLTRSEDRITSAILPGFWTHAALFVGTRETLAAAGVLDHPKVDRLRAILERIGSGQGLVVEAVPRGCRVHTLEYCLRADHVAVLRPNLDGPALRECIVEAFSHVGKPYDFEFDFNVSTRIVCTELIYRSLHGRGAIRFALTKRLGRYTLTADDMVEQLLAQAGAAPFSVVELLLQEGETEALPVPEPERLRRLARLFRRGLVRDGGDVEFREEIREEENG